MALTRPTAAQIVTTTSEFSDPLILVNKDQTGTNTKDIGFIFSRGSDTNVGIIWDESTDTFSLINSSEDGSTEGNVSINSHADLVIGSLTAAGISYPSSDGTFGQAILTDGDGNLSFSDVTPAPAGSNTQVQFNNNGVIGASANLTFNGTTLTSTAFSGPLTGNADTASAWATARTITLSGVLSGNVSIDGSSNVTLTATHTSDPTITLAGDVSGSATMTNLSNVTITATVADDSHNHIIGNIDGLQTALDAKAALAGATFTGDVVGTNLTLSGNLTVSGTTTTINTETVTIADNILLLNANVTGTPTENSGFAVERGTALNTGIQWNETSDHWELTNNGTNFYRILTTNDEGAGNGLDSDTLDGQHGSYYLDWTNTTNKPDPTITLGGDLSGSVTLTDLGNGTLTASLTKDPTLTINGDASGSTTFTNLSNATLTLTIADDSHNHVISNVDGLQTALDGKLSTTGKAADSNLLDGINSTQFLRSDTNDTMTGNLTMQSNIIVDQNGNNGGIVYDLSGGTYIPRPQGAHFVTTSSSQTGVITVKLPTEASGQSDMLSFWVDIFDYAGGAEGESVSIYVYGYQYSSNLWTNTGAVVLSDRTDRDYTVRFGHDGTRHVVTVGETSSIWSYPQVSVRDFQAGYSSSYTNYDSAWDVTFETSLPSTISRTSSNNYPVSKQLKTARTISLGGDLSGNASFDGSANITITGTIATNSITANELNVSGNGTLGQALLSDGDGSFSWGEGGGGGTSYTASSGAPSSPSPGDEWWDTDDGSFYKYIDDGTSEQWVEWGPNNSLNGSELITGNLIPDVDNTYDIGSATKTLSTVYATATSAQYADLAENYTADADYPVGTILQIGGAAEVTIAQANSHSIVGTVSENPAYLMNSGLTGEHVVPVAYIGRVPCRVIGKISRGDLLKVSSVPGVAERAEPAELLPGQLLGKALESYNSVNEGTIEITVGRL